MSAVWNCAYVHMYILEPPMQHFEYLCWTVLEYTYISCYLSEEDIVCASKETIRHLVKDAYVTVFDSWLRRMQKCVDNRGCYTE